MTSHSHFKLLCALEASGQLDQYEHLELLSHCESCESCRAELIGMQSVTSQLLAVRQTAVRGTVPAGMNERFVAKVLQQGIHVSVPRTHSLLLNRSGFAAVAAVFLLCAGYLFSKVIPPSQHPGADNAEVTIVVAQKAPALLPAEHALSIRHSSHKKEASAGKRKLHQKPFISLTPSFAGRSWPALTSSRFVLTGMTNLDQRTCCSYPTLMAVSGTQTWTHFPPSIQKTSSELEAGRVFRYEATLAPMPSMFHSHAVTHGFTLNPGIASPRFVPVATLQPEMDGEEQ